MGELVLVGTARDLNSLEARKIRAAAAFSGVPLRTTTTRTVEGEQSHGDDDEGCDGQLFLTYRYGSSSLITVRSLPTALKLVGRLQHIFESENNICGSNCVSRAQVDAWMEYLGTSVDLPLEAWAAARGRNDNDDGEICHFPIKCWKTLDAYLGSRRRQMSEGGAYLLVGSTGVTLADIWLSLSLGQAKVLGAWNPEDTSTADLARYWEATSAMIEEQLKTVIAP